MLACEIKIGLDCGQIITAWDMLETKIKLKIYVYSMYSGYDVTVNCRVHICIWHEKVLIAVGFGTNNR